MSITWKSEDIIYISFPYENKKVANTIIYNIALDGVIFSSSNLFWLRSRSVA